jgi:hypothetical protein
MGWMNQISDVLQKYTGAQASAPPPNAASDFAKVAENAPSSAISGGIAEAFRSNNTPPFAQMVSQLFGQSDPTQRAGILGHLLSAAGPAALSSGGLGSLVGALSGAGAKANVTPEQAQQISPDAVRQIAEHAEKQDPSIVDRAGEFYAQHPRLVQGLGAGALAIVMSHLSRQQH